MMQELPFHGTSISPSLETCQICFHNFFIVVSIFAASGSKHINSLISHCTQFWSQSHSITLASVIILWECGGNKNSHESWFIMMMILQRSCFETMRYHSAFPESLPGFNKDRIHLNSPFFHSPRKENEQSDCSHFAYYIWPCSRLENREISLAHAV